MTADQIERSSLKTLEVKILKYRRLIAMTIARYGKAFDNDVITLMRLARRYRHVAMPSLED